MCKLGLGFDLFGALRALLLLKRGNKEIKEIILSNEMNGFWSFFSLWIACVVVVLVFFFPAVL